MNESEASKHSATPEDLAGAVLTVDLAAIRENWRLLAKLAGAAECGAAVKGDAYGLGIAPVARALWDAGCRSFFVARPKEGEELRGHLPEAVIYVLDGLFAGQAEFYAKLDLRPALIAIEEAREWAGFGRVYGRKLACALHIDTGINRLGFSMPEFARLLEDNFTMEGLNLTLVMSHLACADEPAHPLNARQRDAFASVRRQLSGVPASLANSAGIFLGPGYAHDLVRPGIALYGGNPTARQTQSHGAGGSSRRHRHAAPRCARRAKPSATAPPGRRNARPASPSWVPATRTASRARFLRAATDGPAQVFIAGERCPVVGRVSMDMMAVDVTDLPRDAVTRGTRAEIVGRNIAVDEAAAWAGTISYELLTRLGRRYARLYSDAESEPAA